MRKWGTLRNVFHIKLNLYWSVRVPFEICVCIEFYESRVALHTTIFSAHNGKKGYCTILQELRFERYGKWWTRNMNEYTKNYFLYSEKLALLFAVTFSHPPHDSDITFCSNDKIVTFKLNLSLKSSIGEWSGAADRSQRMTRIIRELAKWSWAFARWQQINISKFGKL